MSVNPYAAFVADRDPGSLVREFPDQLSAVVSELGPAGMRRSLAPGKWTAAEILCHLADTEIAFSFRWRQALAEENHIVQPFDQDHWATHYSSMSGEEALQTFVALRRWNATLLDRLSPRDWDRRAVHPERGELTFRTLVETMAGHDLNHLAQLEKIARNGSRLSSEK
jgi:DinB superfamily